MSSELEKYIQDIRQRTAVPRRHWYWKKNANRPKSLAYALEYNPVTLLLKTRRYVIRRRMLTPLMAPNRPGGMLRDVSEFRLSRDGGRPNSLEIRDDSFGESVARAEPLPSGNRKLVLLHAYYEDEARVIFDKLQDFTDYDLILTTPIPAIRDEFLRRFDPSRSACFLAANAGRDVLPFLLVLAFQDLPRYSHFVKIHTKRSSHLAHGEKWFAMNLEILIGQKRMTDEMLGLIDAARPSIYGVECRPLRDHFRTNRHWLRHLIPDFAERSKENFIPGTMFAGSAAFLQELAKLNLHLHVFEEEKGQLDGCLVHALERFFGHLAQARGGECATFDSLILRRRI